MPTLVEDRRKRAEDFNFVVGTNIRYMRQAKRITAAKLAEEADISVSHMSRVENGERALTLQQGLAIAKALGVMPKALTASLSHARAIHGL